MSLFNYTKIKYKNSYLCESIYHKYKLINKRILRLKLLL